MPGTHSRSRSCLRYGDVLPFDDCADRSKVLEAMGFAQLSKGRWSYEGKALFVSKVRRRSLRLAFFCSSPKARRQRPRCGIVRSTGRVRIPFLLLTLR